MLPGAALFRIVTFQSEFSPRWPRPTRNRVQVATALIPSSAALLTSVPQSFNAPRRRQKLRLFMDSVLK